MYLVCELSAEAPHHFEILCVWSARFGIGWQWSDVASVDSLEQSEPFRSTQVCVPIQSISTLLWSEVAQAFLPPIIVCCNCDAVSQMNMRRTGRLEIALKLLLLAAVLEAVSLNVHFGQCHSTWWNDFSFTKDIAKTRTDVGRPPFHILHVSGAHW